MRAVVVLSLALTSAVALTGCVDLDGYAPLAQLELAPPARLISVTHAPTDPIRLFALADVDGDGTDDVANVNQDGSVSVHLGGPGPSFAPDARQSDPSRPITHGLLARDLDGDGMNELVAAGIDAWRWDTKSGRPLALGAYAPPAGGDWPAIFGDAPANELWGVRGTSLEIDRWDGTHLIAVAGTPLGGSPDTHLKAADLDGDGALDFVAAPDQMGATGLRVFYGGRASLDAPQLATCGSVINEFWLADVDADGLVDVLAVDIAAHLLWCRSLPGRALDQPMIVTTFAKPAVRNAGGVLVVDLDRDRLTDLVIFEGDVAAPQLRVLRNSGAGLNPLGTPIPISGNPDPSPGNGLHDTRVAAADVDRDGRVDLVVWAFDGFYWLRNLSQ